jgi:hypothetical protein
MKKRPQNRHRLKIPPQPKLMSLPYSMNGLQVLKPLYLNVGPKSQLLRPIIPEEIIPTMDTAQTNMNMDTPPQNITTKRSHHAKKTTAQNPVISGSGKSVASDGGKPQGPPKGRAPRVNAQKLASVTSGVTSLYATIGIFAYARDQYDGLIIMTTAQDRAIELVNVAKHHKWLMDLLIRLTEGSDYVTLAIGHAGLAYALLAHHNQIPKNEALLAQFGYTEAQVAQKAQAMQSASQMQETPRNDVQAQYEAMKQDEPQPANFEGTIYETGLDYDRTNGATENNAASVPRFDETVLETR